MRYLRVSAVLLVGSLAGCTGSDSEPAAQPSAEATAVEPVATATIGCGPADAPQIEGQVQGLHRVGRPAVVVAGEPGRSAPRVHPLSVNEDGEAAFVVRVRTLDPNGLTVTVQDGATVLTTVDVTPSGPTPCG